MITRVEKYELGKTLGEGSFGRVRLAAHSETGEEFAIKILDKGKIKQDNLVDNLRREIEIMRTIEHPNIVKLYQVLSSHSKIYLVLELVTGGELLEKLQKDGPVSEDTARNYFQQIISGISFCEKQHVAHRDLKLENILLDGSGVVKISDFGLSGLFNREHSTRNLMHTTCGTVNYLAPEVFGNQGYDGHVADLWSSGVILYALLTGNLPFEEDSIAKLIEKIVAGNYEVPRGCSPAALELMGKLLTVDPRTRITLENIKRHSWFVEHYCEPQGLLNELNTEEICTVGDGKPRIIDAFELVTFCVGVTMKEMFGVSESQNCFVSEVPCEIISARMKQALEICNFKEECRETDYRIVFAHKITQGYTVVAEIREILEDLYLVVLTGERGSSELHSQTCQRVRELVCD